MFSPSLLVNVPEQLALCVVQIHTACAALEWQDFAAAGLNSHVRKKSRPSAGKILIPKTIAFPFCITSPDRATSRFLRLPKQQVLPLASTKGAGREAGCRRSENCLELLSISLKLDQRLRTAQDLHYLKSCHHPESEWYRAKKGFCSSAISRPELLCFQEQLYTGLHSDLEKSHRFPGSHLNERWDSGASRDAGEWVGHPLPAAPRLLGRPQHAYQTAHSPSPSMGTKTLIRHHPAQFPAFLPLHPGGWFRDRERFELQKGHLLPPNIFMVLSLNSNIIFLLNSPPILPLNRLQFFSVMFLQTVFLN